VPHWTIPPLYAILDNDAVAARGWDPADVCLAWLAGGVRLIQLRAKGLASGPFLELADEVAALCRESGARLIINDRADIAAMAGAAGVHLGQDDLSPSDARLALGDAGVIGLSTHEQGQVVSGAREPVQYLALGPIFATATKDTGYEAVGLDSLRAAAEVTASAGIPLVAIGGLTLDRACEVRAAGADSLAVISDLLAVPDLTGVENRARAWLGRLT
jgi:thiamine-phosphate pyrophosphorylase